MSDQECDNSGKETSPTATKGEVTKGEVSKKGLDSEFKGWEAYLASYNNYYYDNTESNYSSKFNRLS